MRQESEIAALVPEVEQKETPQAVTLVKWLLLVAAVTWPAAKREEKAEEETCPVLQEQLGEQTAAALAGKTIGRDAKKQEAWKEEKEAPAATMRQDKARGLRERNQGSGLLCPLPPAAPPEAFDSATHPPLPIASRTGPRSRCSGRKLRIADLRGTPLPRRRGWNQGLIWKVEVSASVGASLLCGTEISVGTGWTEEVLGMSVACLRVRVRVHWGPTFDSAICNVKSQHGHQAMWKCD